MIYEEIDLDVHSCRMCSSIRLKSVDIICRRCRVFMKNNPPKDRCFICDKFMQPDEDRYIHLGNMCWKCNSKIARRITDDIRKRKELNDLKNPTTGEKLEIVVQDY